MPTPRLLVPYTVALAVAMALAWPLTLVLPPLGVLRHWQLVLNALLALGLVLHAVRHRAWPLPLDAPMQVPRWLRWLLFGCALVWLLSRTVSEFWAFDVPAADFGIFERMLANTLDGRFMYSDVYEVKHFGVHQHYWMLALVPLYALAPSPYLLLAAAALMAWAALFPLWGLARHFIRNEWYAVFLVLAYLGGTFLVYQLEDGFRPEAFYPATALLFLLGWVRRAPRVWVAGMVAFLACREDVALYLFTFGVIAGLWERRPAGAVVAAASVALFLFNLGVVRPANLGEGSPSYMGFWSHYGATMGEVVRAMVLDPLRVARDVVGSRWYVLFGPALLLPFLSVRAIAGALPGLLLFGTANTELRNYRIYGPVVLVGFVLLGILDGVRVLRGWLSPTKAAVVALAALLLFPLVGERATETPRPRWAAVRGKAQLHAVLRASGKEPCVQDMLYPHVPQELRPRTYHGCWNREGAYLVLLPGAVSWPFSQEQFAELERRLRVSGTELPGGFLVGPVDPSPLPPAPP